MERKTGTLAKTYDTVELRRIASVVQESAEDIAGTSKNTVRRIRDEVPEHLSGEAADALKETTDEIEREISSCSTELDEIGLKLKQYAWLLDQADRKAAEMIQSR